MKSKHIHLNYFFEKLALYGTVIQLISCFIAWIGIKTNTIMISYFSIGLCSLIAILFFIQWNRNLHKKNDLRSFMRDYFRNSKDWKESKSETFRLIGHPDRKKLKFDFLMQQATFHLLVNKKYLTYKEAYSIIDELRIDDNIEDLAT